MTGPIHVLLVDDEKPFVLNMERILARREFEVSTAFDGLQAIECFRSGKRYDVVVLDVKMPGMDGLGVLKEIKSLDPDVPVIMLTGHATLTSGIEAIREGAYDYLMKPCDIENLVEKIQEAWEVRNIRRCPVLWPRKTVGEIPLCSVERLGPEDPLEKALVLMRRETGQEAVEELYLVDEEGRFRGYVTKRDLLDQATPRGADEAFTWNVLQENSQWLPPKPLREILRPIPATTNPKAGLAEVAQQMILHKIRSIPVVSEGRALGVLRMKDILHYVDLEME